jgi:uncharacterized protein
LRNIDSTTFLRQISAGFDPGVVSQIDRCLDTICAAENVTIPWAVESGSRAWGFPSPDSDFDCRFVYIRRHDDYLSLFPKRDVIETPLTEVLDINGWDIAKALRLMLKGNAVILEWLTSPDVYRGDTAFRDGFLKLGQAICDRNRIRNHYLHLAVGQLDRARAEGDGVRIKKLFYVLRPAMALRWMRLNVQTAIPPMNFQLLCEGADLPQELADEISRLTLLKLVTREMGSGSAPPAIMAFVETELATSETELGEPTALTGSQIAQADTFFRQCLEKFG